MKKIRIGTRKSRLAVIQAEIVAKYINLNCEGYEAELVKVITTGDQILSKKLDEIGEKGLFVKELDLALKNGVTDLSVHSLKDMPMDVPAELPLIGFSGREDARDVQDIYPGVEIKNMRGNVLTRLEKLDRGNAVHWFWRRQA